jgi:hypothetical protein
MEERNLNVMSYSLVGHKMFADVSGERAASVCEVEEWHHGCW